MRSTISGCDVCGWTGESTAAGKRHHERTGHTTWARTETLTFYGDPLDQWSGEQSLTVERDAALGRRSS